MLYISPKTVLDNSMSEFPKKFYMHKNMHLHVCMYSVHWHHMRNTKTF